MSKIVNPPIERAYDALFYAPVIPMALYAILFSAAAAIGVADDLSAASIVTFGLPLFAVLYMGAFYLLVWLPLGAALIRLLWRWVRVTAWNASLAGGFLGALPMLLFALVPTNASLSQTAIQFAPIMTASFALGVLGGALFWRRCKQETQGIL